LKYKKIIVLGASGFIGRNVCLHLKKKFPNSKIIGVYNKNKIKVNGVKFIKCDLTKSDNKIIKIFNNADVVIQAAATTSGAKDIISKPYIHVNDNAIMNSRITRCAFHSNVKHLLVFSCTVMYHSSNKAIKESQFTDGKKIYHSYFGAAWMKVFVEKMCEFYSRFKMNKYTLIRHSNIYGPYDKYDLDKSHVFGATINKVMNAKKNGELIIWGKGKESRDLLYIDDLLNFIFLAIKKQKGMFEIYNVGYGRPISINNLVKKIVKISKKKIKIKNDLSKKSLSTKIFLDCKKAYQDFVWKPKINLDIGIKKTLKWYKNNA
jgi:GDP-L-fucose synthase